jgi:hypothetical protein
MFKGKKQTMLQISEIEKLFHDEVRQKKKTASGVHHKTGKNGYVGTMRFPSDIMSRKEKSKYRKAGKIVTTNIYDEILPIDQFENLETFEKKNRLAYWRNEHTLEDITKQMQVSKVKYYSIVHELGLPPAPRKRTKKASSTKKIEKSIAIRQKEVVPVPVAVPEQKPTVQEVLVEGLNLVFMGTYKAEQIQKQLTKFSLMVEDEPDDFYFEIRLMQKQSKK